MKFWNIAGVVTTVATATHASFIQTHSGNTLGAGQGIACHFATDRTLEDSESSTRTTTWFGSYVAYLLDFDGSYNYADIPATNGNFEGRFTTSNNGIVDNNPRLITFPTLPTTVTECQQKCLASDNCMVANHEDDAARAWMCNLQPNCANPRLASELPTGRAFSGFVKLQYSTFTASSVMPASTCIQAPVFGPSTLDKSTPVNPVDCHRKCVNELRTPFFMVDGELKCSCYSDCTYVQQAGRLSSGAAIYSTVFEASLPPSVDPTPAPSEGTGGGTQPTTPIPTRKPTLKPTRSPGAIPTLHPTKAADAEEGSSTTLFLAGVGGLTIAVVIYFKWKSQRESQKINNP